MKLKELKALSDKQVNVKIAKLRGWKTDGHTWWHDDLGDGPPPDYANDPNAAWEVKTALAKDRIFIWSTARELCESIIWTYDRRYLDITWDRPKVARFKKAYEKAKNSHSEVSGDVFVFDGHEFVLGYAKYLIEYLEGKL